MTAPVKFPTANGQMLVAVSTEDTLTLRVQTLDGHNRGVAKLGLEASSELYDYLAAHLGIAR